MDRGLGYPPQPELGIRVDHGHRQEGEAVRRRLLPALRQQGRLPHRPAQAAGSKPAITSLNSWPPAQTAGELIDWYLRDAFDRIRANRYLWRAALQRSWDNAEFWEPFRGHGHGDRREALFGKLGRSDAGVPSTQDEQHRLGMAIQVFNSVLSNALLNDPGPLRVDQPNSLPTLEELFMTVSPGSAWTSRRSRSRRDTRKASRTGRLLIQVGRTGAPQRAHTFMPRTSTSRSNSTNSSGSSGAGMSPAPFSSRSGPARCLASP